MRGVPSSAEPVLHASTQDSRSSTIRTAFLGRVPWVSWLFLTGPGTAVCYPRVVFSPTDLVVLLRDVDGGVVTDSP